MARAPPRRLVVDGAAFRWVVGRDTAAWPGFVRLAVWRPGGGRALHVRLRWDDPWLNYGPQLTTPPERFEEVWATTPVAPGRVAGLVRQGLAAGWDPAAPGSPFALTVDPEEGARGGP